MFLTKLGIDAWSIVLYIINVGILFAAIYFLLVPVILKFLDERKNKIADSLNEANNLKEVFEKQLAEMNASKAEQDRQQKAEMDAMKVMIEQRREELMREMDAHKAKLLADAREQIDLKKNSLISDAQAEMMDIIKKVVLFVVQNKVPEDVIKKSIEESWKDYKKA